MLLNNYQANNTTLGRMHSGTTTIVGYLRPEVRFNFFSPDDLTNKETIKRDSFPTGTNSPYAYTMGHKGALISSTTTINNAGAMSGSMAMGRALAAGLSGSTNMTGSLSLIVQLACSLLGSTAMSGSISGVIQMASSLAGSGNLTASMKLLAGVVATMGGSSSITANLRGTASLEANITPFTELSPQSLATYVWTALAAQFNDPPTMGYKLNSAGNAGDPWGTSLPASYSGTQAGNILAQIQTLVDELHKIQGLDASNPMTVTPTTREAGDIELVISGDGETTTTVTRQ